LNRTTKPWSTSGGATQGMEPWWNTAELTGRDLNGESLWFMPLSGACKGSGNNNHQPTIHCLVAMTIIAFTVDSIQNSLVHVHLNRLLIIKIDITYFKVTFWCPDFFLGCRFEMWYHPICSHAIKRMRINAIYLWFETTRMRQPVRRVTQIFFNASEIIGHLFFFNIQNQCHGCNF